MEEEKALKEWCFSCVFIRKGKYLKARDNLPSPTDCIQCMYEKFLKVKITKPSNWRGDQ